ncbi:TPM domain-containing protein [Sinomicrobium soli]|uniref:TPM domain-containing protein n=1 Tax=Sinomicrobium sp. N-1-3-6 TaxID=2219864 RepID=UPI000DCBB5B6|nr:TPM domain-containing protein [Sinomicrobium sp. N-1-3-6]RAV30734.1 TPM domain-containing protein [Sinomicrobium sp. N-1-3-6]
MSEVEKFLTAREEEEIVKAIQEAERNTSGEIRVHIERTSGNSEPYQRAIAVFHELGMDRTELANGVIVYIAVEDRTFAIYGGKGINDVVPDDFWNSTKEVMASRFKDGHYKQGLVEGILKAGNQLKQHFPWQEDDINELPDEISKG